MKRSTAVVLVLSGAMFQGCGQKPKPEPQANWGDSGLTKETTLTNNTYVAGRGYYHAPYFGFFPIPFNTHTPGQGYYHGGKYSPQPDTSGVNASTPGRFYKSSQSAASASPASANDSTRRGGFARSSSGGSRGPFGS